MIFRSPSVQFGCLLAAVVFALTPALRADETSDAFLTLWKQQADQPNTATAWEDFAAKHPTTDLGWFARLLRGADLLRQGEPKSALRVFEAVTNDPQAATTEAHRLVAAAAKGLIARTKMALLAGRLHVYYRKHVEYPASLDDLINAKLAGEADVTDPFGSRFVYAAMERETFPGIERQKFTLTCPSIHAQHDDLAATLEATKAAPKGIVLGNIEAKDHYAYLKKMRPDGAPGPPQRMTAGQELGDVALWGVYDGYVVVGWRQFPVVVQKE